MLKLIAACAFGLEAPVKWELQRLGYAPQVLAPGRICFEGDWVDVCKTNLWLRVADRVLIEVASFHAPDFDALFETTKELDWRHWLPIDAKFPVNARTRNSQLTSLPAIQRSVKKAIVESLLAGHQTGSLPEDGPNYRIELALLDDIGTLTIDTTGASLHKRGYRKSFGAAPIKETLAAALVMLSVWTPQRPLIDPFCGSGTIPIEAAMSARNIAPGAGREFDWQFWPQVDPEIAATAFAEARSAGVRDVELQILGTDNDARVLEAARRNAFYAGVADDIHFQQKPFEELRSKREFGCVIANPPYGERLGERRDLLPLYQSFPAVLQRLPTWSHFLLTGIPDFEGLIQKSATRKRKLFNGRIECMYYQFLGPKPESLNRNSQHGPQPESDSNGKPASIETPCEDQPDDSAALPAALAATRKSTEIEPVFGRIDESDRQQAELFARRLTKRARHLRRWPTRRGITCYRIYERDIPELPFVIDRYEDWFHVTEFERPHDRSPGLHAAWLDLMKKTIAATFEVPIGQVYLKSRRRQAGTGQHQKIDSKDRKHVVHEGGLKFLINFSDYVDTGLFLDHRTTRGIVGEQSDGKRFLNLFGYTGSFSVYAAAGNAMSTTTVDWSNAYLDWARQNMELNGFSDRRHEFVRMDAMDFLQQPDSSMKFDLVVVDPPTFSNSKRTEQVWDVQANHVELLHRLAANVSANGVVYFSTNFRKFKFDESLVDQYSCVEISSQTVPEDFRNRRIHRCWKLTRV